MNNTRREILKGALAAAAGSVSNRATLGLFSGLGAAAAYAQPQDYKAMVCVYLAGGADTYNLLVPYDTSRYDVYRSSRGIMALGREELGVLLEQDGSEHYGLHPAASFEETESVPELGIPGLDSAGDEVTTPSTGLKELYNQGELAFVANMGSLQAPTTLEDFHRGRAHLPPRLFSHLDQQRQWLSSDARGATQRGWAGAIADLIGDVNPQSHLPLNLSLSGTNQFQTGDSTVAYVLKNYGADTLKISRIGSQDRMDGFQDVLGRVLSAGDLFEKYDASVTARSIRLSDHVMQGLDEFQGEFDRQDPASSNDVNVADEVYFPPTRTGAALRMVARLIHAREYFDTRRQIFSVVIGDWDTHGQQAGRLENNIRELSDALYGFHRFMKKLDVNDKVTSFTQSEFARTLVPNFDGTDHAWGGNQLVCGGAVNGQQVYGQYPDLSLDGECSIAGGRMVPTTSVDQYAATLARWFGASEEAISIMLPNLANFTVRDLGFLQT